MHEIARSYVDTEECNVSIVDRFTDNVNSTPFLRAHRDFIEHHVYGFGERAFHWQWKLLVDSMPLHFRFLEVGVYKGQVLSLIRLLADQTGREADIVGITLLSNFSGDTGKFTKFPDTDYAKHIRNLHDAFLLSYPTIVRGDSTSPDIHSHVSQLPLFDIVYVDGCHERDYVTNDLSFYRERVRPGGYLVVDDSANGFHMPFGYFTGIQDVTDAVRTVIETDPRFTHLYPVMHLRTFRRSQ